MPGMGYIDTGTSSATWTTWSNCTITTTSDDSVWNKWNDSAIYVDEQGTAWLRWNNGGTNNHYTMSSATVWANWVIDENGVVQAGQINGQQFAPSVETQDQREQRELRYEAERKIREEAALKEAERQRLSNEKALELLMEVLDEGQQAMMRKDGSFVVIGQKTGKKYRIKKGLVGNVELLDDGDKTFERWCFHVPYGIPEHDNMVAQKLMLELHEEDAIRMANKTRVNA
jgi:hypothetical protein